MIDLENDCKGWMGQLKFPDCSNLKICTKNWMIPHEDNFITIHSSLFNEIRKKEHDETKKGSSLGGTYIIIPALDVLFLEIQPIVSLPVGLFFQKYSDSKNHRKSAPFSC